MKSKLLLLMLAPMTILSATGCSINSGMKLTYGTYITSDDASNCDAVEINYGTLSQKMDETSDFSKENFLLVISPTNGCVCWANFQNVLKAFIADTHYLVYQIKVTEFGEDTMGFKMQQGHVSFAIVKGGKIVKQYMSSNIFDSATSLKAEVNKYVRAPELYFVNQDYLDDKIKYQETVFVEYMKSSCPDCNYSDPNSLWPYASQNTFKNKMYIIDLDELDFGIEKYEKDSEGNYIVNEHGSKITTEAYKTSYQEFKDVHYLSNTFSSEFGYGNGVVPTFQYYERGKLKDMMVFYNDSVEKVGDDLIVTNSYYDEYRKVNLGYVSDVKTTVLKGLKLTLDDVDDYTAYGYGYSWKHAKADIYYKPLFNAFMNKYAK